jgi:Na+-transporting methylmalonyl-CoA/oxaloacetate decarboxylase beta subunit
MLTQIALTAASYLVARRAGILFAKMRQIFASNKIEDNF